ncbi:MAG TPA: hypothetical protein DDW89_01950 [Gammaproteobacteria bacterium]|nr:hypothetical protein [Gammaproteobacteria bacterium]
MPMFQVTNTGVGTLATYSGAELVEIRPGQTLTVDVPEMSPVMRGWVDEGRAAIKPAAAPPKVPTPAGGQTGGAESQGGGKASGDKPEATGKAGGK